MAKIRCAVCNKLWDKSVLVTGSTQLKDIEIVSLTNSLCSLRCKRKYIETFSNTREKRCFYCKVLVNEDNYTTTASIADYEKEKHYPICDKCVEEKNGKPL